MNIELVPRIVHGRVVSISDGGIKIAFDGILGELSIPSRLVISDTKPEQGDEVEIYLSYAHVIKRKEKSNEVDHS